jgi:hypothetical protein
MKQIFKAFVGKLKQRKQACAVFVLCAMTAISLSAQTFTTLVHRLPSASMREPKSRLPYQPGPPQEGCR